MELAVAMLIQFGLQVNANHFNHAVPATLLISTTNVKYAQFNTAMTVLQ